MYIRAKARARIHTQKLCIPRVHIENLQYNVLKHVYNDKHRTDFLLWDFSLTLLFCCM